MAYVMLGRPERKEDLYITKDFDPSEVKCDEKYSLPESKRLSQVFDDSENAKKEHRDKNFKISYLNVRSMKAADGHRKDIALDNVIMNTDMFGLAETWLEQDQQVNFNGFNGYFANFGNGKGIAGYSKLDLSCQPETVSSKTYSAIMFKTRQFHIIFLYISSNYDKNDLFALLHMWIEKDTPTAVMGDVNENLGGMRIRPFMKKMYSLGFEQLIKNVTCDTGSTLDHIYVNDAMKLKGITTEIDAAYYSDHDIISLNIPKEEQNQSL